MGRHRTWLIGAFMSLLVASFALGEPADQPDRPRRGGRRGQEGAAGERPRTRSGGGQRQRGTDRAGLQVAGKGFIFRYLRNNEHFRAELKKHRETLAELHKHARALREEVKKKLNDPDLTHEQKQEIIEQAKRDTAAIFGRIVGEAIRHRNVVTRIIDAEKENIVHQAAEQIFSRRRLSREGGPGSEGRGRRSLEDRPKGGKPREGGPEGRRSLRAAPHAEEPAEDN